MADPDEVFQRRDEGSVAALGGACGQYHELGAVAQLGRRRHLVAPQLAGVERADELQATVVVALVDVVLPAVPLGEPFGSHLGALVVAFLAGFALFVGLAVFGWLFVE